MIQKKKLIQIVHSDHKNFAEFTLKSTNSLLTPAEKYHWAQQQITK